MTLAPREDEASFGWSTQTLDTPCDYTGTSGECRIDDADPAAFRCSSPSRAWKGRFVDADTVSGAWWVSDGTGSCVWPWRGAR